MRLPVSIAAFVIASSSSVPAMAQTLYEPLTASSDWTLESADGGPALVRAIAMTDWPDGAPILEGWVSAWVYMRLYDDRQVFFVLVDEDAAEEKYVCRVSFESFPSSNSNRDADASLARLGALCERERLDNFDAAPMRAVSPGQPGGPQSGERLVYELPDGTRLTIEHVENTGIWLPALPPEIASDPLVIGSLPTPRTMTSNRHDRFWYVREESGRWGLSFHFGHGQDLGRSGCFIRNVDDPADPPDATWLTEASLEWCRNQQRTYADANPRKTVFRVPAPPAMPAPAPRN